MNFYSLSMTFSKGQVKRFVRHAKDLDYVIEQEVTVRTEEQINLPFLCFLLFKFPFTFHSSTLLLF